MAYRHNVVNLSSAYFPSFALLFGLLLFFALQGNTVWADHDPQTTSISCTASGGEVTCTLAAPEGLPIAFSFWFLNGVLVGDFDGTWESINHSASHTFTPDCGDTTVAANGVYVDDDTIQHHVATAQTPYYHACPSASSVSGASGQPERAQQSVASPPGRAHSLTAAQSGNSVALSWSAPTDGGAVNGYRILRRLPDRGEQSLGVLVNNTGSTVTSYTDSSAQVGQKHIYRVQALGRGGDGQRSLPAQIVMPGTSTQTTAAANSAPPGRAQNLAAAQSGDSVALSWSAPVDGGAVNGYRILRRLPDRGERSLVVLVNNTGSAGTSYTDSSAQAGQKHIYRVQALGSGGEGQRSLPAQIVLSS